MAKLKLGPLADSVYRVQRVMEGRLKLKRYQDTENKKHPPDLPG